MVLDAGMPASIAADSLACKIKGQACLSMCSAVTALQKSSIKYAGYLYVSTKCC